MLASAVSLATTACGPVAAYRVGGYFTNPRLTALEGKTVAVLPFRGGATEPVTDIANLEFGRVNRWRLVERIRVQELYNEQDFDPERIDDDEAVRIGKMLGAQAVVLGQVTEYTRPRCSVSMRLVSTETGEHLWQARDTLESRNIAVQKLAEDRYDAARLSRDPEALASVTVRALVETINR
jgi:hypothetical protein